MLLKHSFLIFLNSFTVPRTEESEGPQESEVQTVTVEVHRGAEPEVEQAPETPQAGPSEGKLCF